MVDYMVIDYTDYTGHDYILFKTEQEARDYIAEQVDTGDYTSEDFAIFARNRLAFP